MERAWLTQDCWFRLTTTLAGIYVTDCWKLVKYHISASHPYSAITMDFAEILSNTLVSNELQNHVVPAQRRRMTRSVPLAEPKWILQEEGVHVPGNFDR
jgi:capsid protein